MRLRAMSYVTLTVAATLVGCVWTTPQPVLVREPRPELVPLRIGVHYPSELRDFRYRHHITDTRFVLGAPSVRLLDEALRLLFAEVAELPTRDARAGGGEGVAGIIEPRITSAAYRYPPTGVRHFPTHITYTFTLYSPAGASIAVWSVTGEGNEPIGNPLEGVAMIRRNFEQAMREAAWKLMNEFREIPELARWLEERGVR